MEARLDTQPETLTRRRRRWPWMTAAFVAAWLVLELGARVVVWRQGPEAHEPLSRLYQPHPYRVYALVPGAQGLGGRIAINAGGFRGPELTVEKPPGTLRIVCLGESATFGDAVTTNGGTYPAHLERRLRAQLAGRPMGPARIEVINAGVPGYTSLESLIHFESRVLDYAPDIALWHHGLNDAVFLAHFREFATDYTHARCVFRTPRVRLWERSALLTLVLPGQRALMSPYHPRVLRSLAQLTFTEPGRLTVSADEQGRCFDPARLETFARNVRNFVYVARGQNVVPVLATAVCAPEPACFAEVVGQVNERIRAVAAQRGVRCVDVARALPWCEELYEADGMPTAEGLARMGRVFAEALVGEHVVDEAITREVGQVGNLPDFGF